MNSRERVARALNHRQPDRVPLDLGGFGQTGMHVDTVYLLRQALGLDQPGTPVKVVEPYQMSGEIGADLIDALGVDVVGMPVRRTMFGFKNEGWKPWTTFGGTPVLVPAGFNTDVEENGDLLMYAQGDQTYPPCARMPAGGYYFDSLPRQQPIVEDRLKPEDNLEEFGALLDEELDTMRRDAVRLYEQTDKAIVLVLPASGFGDIALVPAPNLRDPRGIRDVEEWYVSLATRPDFVYRVFQAQCEIAMGNLEGVHSAVGDRISVVSVSGTDFGAQHGPLISPHTYRKLFMPFHKRINDWVHANTGWKTFIHCCGSIMALIPLFIEAGFDVLNPVQTTAKDMDAGTLKARFGDRITFWGGGVDTQKVLPFGTPEQVRQQVKENVAVFAPGGGFVFNPIHNVQAGVPVQNLLAMYDALRACGVYPT